MGKTVGQDARFPFSVTAPVEPDNGDVFHQQDVGGNLRDLATGKTERDDAGLGVAGTKGGFELIAADWVIDHVGPAQGFDGLADVLCGTVDQVIRACLRRYGQFVGPARTGDYCRAHHFAKFHRRKTYSARCTEHQQRLTRLQASLIVERHMAGPVGHQKRGCVHI